MEVVMKKTVVVPFLYVMIGAGWSLLVMNWLAPVPEGASAWPYLGSQLPLLAFTCLLLYILLRREEKGSDPHKMTLRFRMFIDALPDYICVKDRYGRVVEMNEKARNLLQVEEKSDLEGIEESEPYRQSFCACRESDRLVWETGEPCRREEEFIQEDGTVRYYDVIKVPVMDRDPSGNAILVIGRDVTDRKSAEAELLATKEQLESFLLQTPDAISLIDTEGRVLRCNQASERIFGYTQEEMVGCPIVCIPPHLQAEADYYHRQVLNGKHIIGLETIRYHKNGTPLNVSLSLSPIFDSHGKIVGIAGSARDITEQKRVEKRLRVSETKFRLIAENMSDMICIFQEDGTITYASPSHKMILGYAVEDYIDVNWLDLVHPDDVEQIRQGFLSMRKDKSLTTFEFRLRHRDGHHVHLEARGKPMRNEEGEITGFLVVSRDITEQKRTEELLRQSDKLSAIGQLAAGIAHEIRNPLTALRGFIQLLQSTIHNKKYCEIMLAELDRINFIVSELLLLAKPQVVKYQVRELSAILHNVISLLDSQAILNNIQIHTSLPEDLPPICCEENQIRQVFINIFKNAIEAMPEGGKIVVEGRVTEDGRAAVRIVDSGCGIDPARIPKLGEPFYTTKEKGTGLGLMVSYKIIEDHGGHITISSELNKGTTVEVILPAARAGGEEQVKAMA
jgi:two-component system sporulation sensor kinase A